MLSKANKKTDFIWTLFKIAAGLAVAWSLWVGLHKYANSDEPIHFNGWFVLFSVLLLPVNYFLEYRKWVVTLQCAKVVVQRNVKIKSFAAGILSGMLTPNMQGNFLGRIYYFQRSQRIPIVYFTLYGNLAQFLVTAALGITAWFFLDFQLMVDHGNTLFWLLFGLVVLGYLFFLRFEYFNLPTTWRRLKNMQVHLGLRSCFKWRILWLSFLRQCVFSFQFWLLLAATGMQVDESTLLWIWLIYLVSAILPSLFLGKLGIRESVSVWILGGIGMLASQVVIASFSVWVINLFIPTLVSLFIARKK